MIYALLLSLVACSEEAPETVVVQEDSSAPQVEEVAFCTQDGFCDELRECYGFMELETCQEYYTDGMGLCADATEDVLVEYHECVCDCWASDSDRNCLVKGTCSDWCAHTICSLF
jgi:hypothetical protein